MSVLDALLGEAFDEAKHPRGWHGRWILSSGGGWHAGGFDELHAAVKGLKIDEHLRLDSGHSVHAVNLMKSGITERHYVIRPPKGISDVHRSALGAAREATGRPRRPYRPKEHSLGVINRPGFDQPHEFRGLTTGPLGRGSVVGLTAGDEPEGVGLLLEAFAGAGGGFNTSKHPRGGHGYFITTGSQGSGVQRVQGALGVSKDGQYGAQTRAAVMKWQRAHGLVVDGVIGRQTAASLLGDAKASKIAIGAMSAKQASALGVKLTGIRTTRKARSSASRKRTATRRRSAQTKQSASPTGGGGIVVG